ncbi:hypothetical protein [Sulfolobus spindle-shaped virus]|nr:hypothetical protein [Sulfolobus spindle-shaped virus]QGA87260.1 hypothetical protein [Sulfolobus spindle-shaped virus]QGA87286.1 hypothetical protein [Sulfolobus spindle-shaped virus]
MFLTELIPEKVLVYGAIIDTIFIIMYLLARKSKTKQEKFIERLQNIRLLGYYLIGASIFTLLIVHMAEFSGLVDYYLGLSLDSLLFFIGLKMVMKNE